MKNVDLSKVRTYPIAQRSNLVTLRDLVTTDTRTPDFKDAGLEQVVHRVIAARRNDRPEIWMMGAHVIKSGLSRVLFDLHFNCIMRVLVVKSMHSLMRNIGEVVSFHKMMMSHTPLTHIYGSQQ